nr:short-chain collagen C4 [Crassostrea gigas]
MMKSILFLMIVAAAQAERNTGECKEMLQGYLTGQLASALGAYQVEALRREFKGFTDVIEKSMRDLKENVETKLKKIKDTSNSSAVYTRWGRKSCPASTDLVLSGYVGGSQYTHTGAAVEPLCLPRNPEWGDYRDGKDGYKAYIYGAEYETSDLSGKWLKVDDHDVPCAVCLVRNKSVVKMFPARKTCDKGWKLEYNGYLMAGHYNHNAGTSYTCVDSDPETLQGEHIDNNGYLFYMVEAMCGSLKCPPYVNGRDLVCAVCSLEN